MRKSIILFVLVMFAYSGYSEENKWVLIKERYNTKVMDVDVLDSLNAIALTRFAGFTEVEKSTDGGETWEMIYTEDMDKTGNFPIPDKAYDIAMPGKDTVYIAYDKGQLRRSYDGGYSYDTVFFDTEYSVGGIKMYNSQIGLINAFRYMPDSSDYKFTGFLYYTKDGWDTWEELRPDLFFNETVTTNKQHIFSPNHFAVIGEHVDIGTYYYSTADAGITWKKYRLREKDSTASAREIYFLNDKIGWIVTSQKLGIGAQRYDQLFKTTDGGETWELNYMQLNEPNFGLHDIAFKDEMNGIATGPWGKILRTTDGGESWNQEYPQDNEKMKFNTQVLIRYFGSKPVLCTAGTGSMFWKEKYPAGIQEDTRFEHTKIYPNPATPGKLINLDIEPGQFTGRIYNINGEIVQRPDIAARSFFLSPDISAGVYLLLIESAGEVIAREKFIVK